MPQSALIDLPRDLQDLVERELAPGERLIWARQPMARYITVGTVVGMVFGVIFSGFALVWIGVSTLGRAAAGAPGPIGICFPLFGLPFLLVGLAILGSPFWNHSAMSRTVYAITDRRALVLRLTLRGGVSSKSFGPDRLTRMEKTERRDGSGDLVFEVIVNRTGSSTSTTREGFLELADVGEAEDTLRRTLLDGRTRPIG